MASSRRILRTGRNGGCWSIVLGKHSGKATLRLAMRDAGINSVCTDAAVLDRIHQYARDQKAALDAERVASWSELRPA